MTLRPFQPTDEQRAIVEHAGPGFISACPGSGKTRVMVERARHLLCGPRPARGVAFLSFTNAAVSELELRLREDGLLPSPAFPHFIGTFDSFLWQFLIAPFGVPGFNGPAHLIPDKDDMTVTPYNGARELPLGCFDRVTGNVIPEVAQRLGFDPAAKAALTKAYETTARKRRAQYLEKGELDFDDVRILASQRLRDAELAPRLAGALSGRFGELIVDEAQDCNPADLDIIKWLRDAGIVVKIISDPHQSIYAFRGGVTEQLIAFGETFQEQDRLTMSGNFRSSDHICKAIVALRNRDARAVVDQALGQFRDEPTPVYVLSYSGRGVPETIGAKFQELASALDLDISQCPVLAATRNSGYRAIGQPQESNSGEMTVKLAEAVTDFHFSFETANRRTALENLHRIVLELEGHLIGVSYHQHLKTQEIDRFVWRPRILQLANDLRYDPTVHPTVDAWHDHAKALLAPCIPAGSTINQRLRRVAGIADALGVAPAAGVPAKTIHSVKGMQFPAVCVVMTSQTAKGILDYLETGNPPDSAEDAREIYVAASRAERLLVIAVPKSQAERLAAHLGSSGAQISFMEL